MLEKKIDFSLRDIHDEEFEKIFEELATVDIKSLCEQREDFVKINNCPACLGKDTKFALSYQGFDYQRCDVCELLFISPVPTVQQHLNYIKTAKGLAFWRENMPERMKKSRMNMYVERANYVIEKLGVYYGKIERMMEIGAGNGELAEALYKKKFLNGKKLTLVDPQPLKVDISGVSVISDVFSDHVVLGQCDVLMAFEVLEHFIDPEAFMTALKRNLKPGGILILSTPNANSLEVEILQKLSSNIFFDHVRLYNPKALRLLLERFGFEILEITTPGRLDVQMVKNFVDAGLVDLDFNPALAYILQYEKDLHKFQKYIQRSLRSSHMRCIARNVPNR